MIDCPNCYSDRKIFTGFYLGKERKKIMMKGYICKDCGKVYKVPADVFSPGYSKKKEERRKCESCGSFDYHAKGLCNTCYTRERRKRKKEGMGKC